MSIWIASTLILYVEGLLVSLPFSLFFWGSNKKFAFASLVWPVTIPLLMIKAAQFKSQIQQTMQVVEMMKGLSVEQTETVDE